MRTTVFIYETEGQQAKDAAAVERAKDKTARAIAMHVDAWDGETPRASAVHFMDDVQQWKRDALTARVVMSTDAAPAMPETTEDSFRRSMSSQGLTPRRGRPPKAA